MNRRWGNRHKLKTKAQVYVAGKKVADGVARNISYSGMYIDIKDRPSSVRGPIDVILEKNAKNRHDIHVKGTIVRSTKGSIAVMFEHLNPKLASFR